jgi:rSAM/selenodomain-associated transferase 1
MLPTNDACLLIFVRYPKRGEVKRRLSLILDEDTVLDLYRCFVIDTMSLAFRVSVPFIICYTPSESLSLFKKWLGSSYDYAPQTGRDLGERMMNSFQYAFKHGYKRVVLIGSDCPDLPERLVSDAYESLGKHDVVLGPAADGGYYLIGLREQALDPTLFQGVEWGASNVFNETMNRCSLKGYTVSVLPQWWDVDTCDDLVAMIKRNKDSSFMDSNTMRYIKNKEINTWIVKRDVLHPYK